MFINKYYKNLLAVCLLILMQFVAVNTVSAQKSTPIAPKYVFLFIGDGMGPNQVRAAEKFYDKLAFSEFEHQGKLKTNSLSGVTDSAAAATALACGTKTTNSYLGLDKDQNELSSVAYKAKQAGFAIGIVTSMQLDNATPAGFFAHRPSRKQYYEIATDLAMSNFDYFAGGGLIYPNGKNGDKESIWDILQVNGYRVINSREEFDKLERLDGKIYIKASKLYEDATMPFAIDKMGGTTLAELTAKGIQLLDNKKGFFMMIEGGKIDYGGHTNDLATNIAETKAFSDAVQVAVDFYNKHPKETLIVVTADHETGGMTWANETVSKEEFRQIVSGQQLSYQEFGKLVQEYVQNGNQGELTDWLPVFQARFGLDHLSEQEYEYLQQAAYASVRREKYGPYEPLMIAVCKVLAQRAGIAWSTYGHSGVDVPIYAHGKHGEQFAGHYENNEVAAKLSQTIGLK